MRRLDCGADSSEGSFDPAGSGIGGDAETTLGRMVEVALIMQVSEP